MLLASSLVSPSPSGCIHGLVDARLIAAYFVQSAVSAYEGHIGSNPQNQEELGKEASNLVVLISELYNFQVVSCILIYDLVRDLLSQPQLSEYTVELLLKIVRSKYPCCRSRCFSKPWKIPAHSSDKMTHPR